MDEIRARILVMDDEAAIRALLSTALGREGYDVAQAEDGGEAVTKYSEAFQAGRPFDLVILDVRVPGGMGGEEALREIRRVDPMATVMASTGSVGRDWSPSTGDHAFNGYLAKPYAIGQLRQRVEEVLAQRPGADE